MSARHFDGFAKHGQEFFLNDVAKVPYAGEILIEWIANQEISDEQDEYKIAMITKKPKATSC